MGATREVVGDHALPRQGNVVDATAIEAYFNGVLIMFRRLRTLTVAGRPNFKPLHLSVHDLKLQYEDRNYEVII